MFSSFFFKRLFKLFFLSLSRVFQECSMAFLEFLWCCLGQGDLAGAAAELPHMSY